MVTAQGLVGEFRTALHVESIGNDGVCGVINPAALFNQTDINSTAVHNEACRAAAVAIYLSGIAQAVMLDNRLGVYTFKRRFSLCK